MMDANRISSPNSAFTKSSTLVPVLYHIAHRSKGVLSPNCFICASVNFFRVRISLIGVVLKDVIATGLLTLVIKVDSSDSLYIDVEPGFCTGWRNSSISSVRSVILTGCSNTGIRHLPFSLIPVANQ